MAAARPRRLPTRVYWFRRGLVLVVALSMVVGVAHLLGATGGDAPAADRASVAAASVAPAPVPEYGPLEAVKVRPRKVKSAAPAEPSGPCRPEDIAAVPSATVGGSAEQATEEPDAEAAAQPPEAGRPVTISLALQGTQPACTFRVGPGSVAVKVTTEDGDAFWSSQACPRQLPRETVVVRSSEPTVVSMTWSARDSEAGCGQQSLWALPGFYRLHATVQGSSPTDVPLELVRPSAVYKTAKPRPRREQAASEASEPSPAPESPAPSASPDR